MPEPNGTPLAELRGVWKTYGAEGGRELTVLKDVSLAIQPGEVVAVLGPSGCGKSTLLRILTGLVPPTRGEVLCHGEPLEGFHPGAAIVFQSFALYPWLTVQQNVRIGLYGKGVPGDEADARVHKRRRPRRPRGVRGGVSRRSSVAG